MAWVSRGKNREAEGDVWYDRGNKRCLFIGDFVIPEGIIDPNHFGVPVPRFSFIYNDGRDGLPKRVSSWMYRTMEPRPLDSGREALTPEASELPCRAAFRVKIEEAEELPECFERTSRGATEEEEESGGKGKGKARAVEEEEEDDYGHGMDVDEPTASDQPSNVVVVDRIDPSISAILFHRLTTDGFSQAHVSPLAIVNGRGRMWVRFETASEGLHALGAAAQIRRSEAAYFSSDGEFHDAATYSRDQWSLETEDVEMAPPAPEVAEVALPVASPSPIPSISAFPSLPAPTPLFPPPTTPTAASTSQLPVPEASTAASAPCLPPAVLSAIGTADTDPPRAPRAMLREAESSLSRLSLEDRLSDPVATPLAQRLSDPLPRPPPPSLTQRMASSAPSLATRMSSPGEEPPSKRQCTAAVTGAEPIPVTPATPPPPSKRKRHGTRADRLVKEQKAAREKRKAEAEALAAQAEATGDSSLLSWIPTLVIVTDEEVREMEELDGTAGWSHEGDDDDDDLPIAGPSRLR
ncbi:hypothetical protein DFH09DRAFT_1313193 [Mycena vulgaris]|nr:hypothetical protein DFH09DRAFT_1313193 [Mycena vulgaris]